MRAKTTDWFSSLEWLVSAWCSAECWLAWAWYSAAQCSTAYYCSVLSRALHCAALLWKNVMWWIKSGVRDVMCLATLISPQSPPHLHVYLYGASGPFLNLGGNESRGPTSEPPSHKKYLKECKKDKRVSKESQVSTSIFSFFQVDVSCWCADVNVSRPHEKR